MTDTGIIKRLAARVGGVRNLLAITLFLVVALTIPLALLATFLGLTWVGIPANLLSLGAMDFGIIVDGAVLVVENVYRNLAEHAKEL